MGVDPTIKDVARALGIHHATVSRALNGNTAVKSATRELIIKKAEEMGYKPNLLAKGFRNGRTNTIAVIVPDLRHHFFAGFVSAVSRKAYDAGFSLMVFQSDDKYEIEKQIIHSLRSYRVAGIAASITEETIDSSHFNLLAEDNVPIVYFDRVPDDALFSTITINNKEIIYNTVKRMSEKGKRKIAYLYSASQLSIFRERLAGYTQAMHDLKLSYTCMLASGYFKEDGYTNTEKLMNMADKPDCILCMNDEVAIGALKYLHKNNYRIPEDVALVGFDNNPMVIASTPEIASIDQLIDVFSDQTINLLLSQISGASQEIKKIVLSANLIERQSI